MSDHIVSMETLPQAWDSFVSSHCNATAYHQHAWKAVIRDSFGHSPYFLSATDREGAIQGILPLVHMKSLLFGNFLVSVPFVNYGGLLCNTPDAKAALLLEAERVRRECRAHHVELRHLADPLEALPTRTHKVTMVLDLAADSETQWRGFNPKLRNQVRKAQKSGLCCVCGHLDLLDDFYAVFARNMRDLGTPVYPKKFFRKVLEGFPESTRVFAVSSEGKTVAAGIALWFKNTLEVPWASSIREFRPLCPNDLLYWEILRFAIGNGFQSFDFGRSTPGEGTYHFKKQWGAVPVQLSWQYLLEEGKALPDLSPKNPKFSLAIEGWKRLPLGVTRLLGPYIIRNIP